MARMIGVGVRINNVLQGPVGKFPDGRDDLIGQLRVPGIHQQYALLSYLQGDVAARTRHHVNASLHRQNLYLCNVEVLILLSAGDLDQKRASQENSGGEYQSDARRNQ